MAKSRAILIQGARTHTLKNISCRIPHGQITVVTGPSGSGKSSLAFDTLYAEGQRRFMESMSTYARQFLERLEKPDVDQIQYILPAIALEQKNHVRNARSTVGTSTEIDDFLRVLLATVGQTRCPQCGGFGDKATIAGITAELKALPAGTKVIVAAPVSLDDFSLASLRAKGYFRVWHAGGVMDFSSDDPPATTGTTLPIILDRLVLRGDATKDRLTESLRKAFELNPDQVNVYFPDTETQQLYRTAFSCQACHTPLTEPFPHLFSFNHPLGACPACEGFGRVIGLDLDKVIPNRSLSLQEGAIHPFNTPANQELYDQLMTVGKKRKIRLNVPYSALNEAERRFVLEGSGDYPGVSAFFEWLESKKYKVHVRVMLAKYRGYSPCPSCQGSRLRPAALQVTLCDKTLLEIGNTPVSALLPFFESLPLTPAQWEITQRLRREILGRLQYLEAVGLGYLTLSRQSRTLSGGEAQRINLSSALGSALTDTLYVLDEPTVGLHARDTQRLLSVLKALRDAGNTLVVVEHDPEMILGGDRVLDLGPSGGQAGGHVVYEGPTSDFLAIDYSVTATTLRQPPGTRRHTSKVVQQPSLIATGGDIVIGGATGNNLKGITVRLPKNQLVCVSGVSGSGKSTLIKQTLYAGYQQAHGRELAMDAAPCTGLEGLEVFEDVLLVDQSPPGRSVRSNPVTYVKAYDEIRKLFAGSRQAMALGITASHFSFNSPGGRCDTCEGLGTLTIDMQFMADVTVTCHDCEGHRFSPAVLAVTFEERTIAQVLDLTVEEAMIVFQQYPRVVKKLWPLAEIGLGYLHLGQSTATLSGGEAQRLKLASYLATTQTARPQPYLFLFDEPTTGLHLTDIQTLIEALRKLLAAGHSVVVVEHNLELLAHADYLVDLGPEGGDAGGQVVAAGSVDTIMATPASITGQFLQRMVTGQDKASEKLPPRVLGQAG